MDGTIIALRSSEREVLWFEEGVTLFRVMEEWLVHGTTFTILEYHHKRKGIDVASKAEWWDDRLLEQGYDIYKEREL